MAYTTGNYTDASDALQAAVTWLQGLGWTIHQNSQGATTRRVHLSKGGMYIHLLATSGTANPWAYYLSGASSATAEAICIYSSTGYDDNLAWNAQPGGPIQSGQTYNVGAGTRLSVEGGRYDFYSDPLDNVILIFEGLAVLPALIASSNTDMATIHPLNCGYVGWGRLKKYGEYVGGDYFFGSVAGRHVLANQYTSTGSSYLLSSIDVPALCPFSYFHYSYTQNAYDVNWWVYCEIPEDNWSGWVCQAVVNTAGSGFTGKLARSGVPGYDPSPRELLGLDLMSPINMGFLSVQPLPLYIFVDRTIAVNWRSPMGEAPELLGYNVVQFMAGWNLPRRHVAKRDGIEYVLYDNWIVRKYV